MHSWLHWHPDDHVLVALHATIIELCWMVWYSSHYQYM